MRVYLVGGAVRDGLLGRTPGDRDFVVVGATAAQMLADGYTPVGRDFPVFLHPHTREEYALARTERKSAHGYRGFVVDADAQVTLEQDLARRDFTINAIARDTDGALIDPFDGAADITARVLRHVSPAFVEDPVRVLRAARFMARFAPLGFTVAPQTMALMAAMVDAGEVDHLVPERVWQELTRALTEPRPSAFIATLRACGALARILPEVDALFGVPQRVEFHPEVDTGIHQMMVSDMAARLAPGDARIGFAALTHDLGKALTPAHLLPRHHGHELAGLKPLAAVCDRLKVPSAHRELAIAACREHLNIHRIHELHDASVHDLIARCDGVRKPWLIDAMATVCEADKRGRLNLQESAYPSAGTLRRLLQAMLAVDAQAILAQGVSGPDVGKRLREARIAAIGAARVHAGSNHAD